MVWADEFPRTGEGGTIEPAVVLDSHQHVTRRALWESADVSIAASTSRCETGTWRPAVVETSPGVVLPRVGAFRRRTNGQEHIVDRATGYFKRVGEVCEVAHFADGVHGATIIDVAPERSGSALAEIRQARGPFVVGPDLAAAHLLLLASVQRDPSDDLEVQERTFELLGACMTRAHAGFRSVRPRESTNARRRVVADVCEHLHASDRTSLIDIADAVHYSPFHLTRVFRSVTGITMSQYRTNLRLCEVLTRLADGGTNLSEIGLAAGFADHAHMTRTFVANLGATPSELRLLLRGGSPSRAANRPRRSWGERPLPSETALAPYYLTWR